MINSFGFQIPEIVDDGVLQVEEDDGRVTDYCHFAGNPFWVPQDAGPYGNRGATLVIPMKFEGPGNTAFNLVLQFHKGRIFMGTQRPAETDPLSLNENG